MNNREKENILVKTIEEVIEDRTGAGELNGIVDISIEELKKIRYNFDITLSSQPAPVQKACESIVARINRLFEDYERSLQEIFFYSHSFDKAILRSALEVIPHISSQLDKAFFDFRQTGLKALGPTDVPGINLLIDITQKIIGGENLSKRLKEIVFQEKEIAEDCLKGIKEGDTQGIMDPQALEQAYTEYLQNLNMFEAYFSTNNARLLYNMIPDLLRTGRLFKVADGAVLMETLSQDPTKSPLANLVINSARGVLEATVPQEQLEEFLRQLWEQVQSMKFKYNALQRHPAESREVEEEAVIVEEALGVFEEGLNLYYDFLETGNPDMLSEAEERVKDAVQELEQSMNIFQKIAETEGKVPCIRCGHYNPTWVKVCEKCSALLSSLARESALQRNIGMTQMEEIPREEVMMTENVAKLLDSAQQFSQGSISGEEFEAVLTWIESLLKSAYDKAGSIPQPVSRNTAERKKEEELYNMLSQTSEIYLQGLEDFEVGLSFLRQFAVTRSPDGLQAGTQMIYQSLSKLQQVQKITEPLTKGK